jgi:hypothetical protein
VTTALGMANRSSSFGPERERIGRHGRFFVL